MTLYYETEAMARMRVYLESQGHTEDQVNAFKRCLTTLERAGLCLSGPALPTPIRAKITPIVPLVQGDAFDECTCPACQLEDSFIQIERR